MEVIFSKGIPGFEELRNFSIKPLVGNEKFKVLQSKEIKEISFVIASPFDFYEDYEINLTDEIIKELKVKKAEDVLVFNIITIGKTLESSTVNLQAPLVININSNLGKQYIMQNSKYETKNPLIRRE